MRRARARAQQYRENVLAKEAAQLKEFYAKVRAEAMKKLEGVSSVAECGGGVSECDDEKAAFPESTSTDIQGSASMSSDASYAEDKNQ